LSKQIFEKKAQFLRTRLAPLFNSSNVLSYFSGHEHNLQVHAPKYQKTKYFVSGAGAKIDGFFSAADSGLEFYYDQTPGFLVVTAAPGNTLLVDFIDVHGRLKHQTRAGGGAR